MAIRQIAVAATDVAKRGGLYDYKLSLWDHGAYLSKLPQFSKIRKGVHEGVPVVKVEDRSAINTAALFNLETCSLHFAILAVWTTMIRVRVSHCVPHSPDFFIGSYTIAPVK